MDSARRWLDALTQDARFALRLMLRNRGFAAVAVLTLALGIGGNALVFSLLDAVVLRPLPYADPARLYMLWTVEAESQRAMNASYPDFRDWQEQSRTFEGMAAFQQTSFNLTGTAEPERVDALAFTPGLLELLGIRPVLGRSFARGEGGEVVLLGHGLWVRRFGGDATIVGRPAQLDGRRYTILGVLPPGFHFPPKRFSGDPEVFVPLTPNRERASWYLRVVGRLRASATAQQAQAEMVTIAARLAAAYPANRRRQGIKLDPMHSYVVSDSRQTALVLMGAVAFVLLIACGNVANLLLSQGAARRREMAIRAAIGASRGRIVRQLLLESVLLAAIGGALGIALARWGLPLIAAASPERTAFFTRVRDAGVYLNWSVLGFTAAVTLAAAILFGVLPALKSTRPAGSSARSYRQGGLRGALVAAEVGLSFVLLAGAGLMMNSMLRLLEVDLGFSTQHLLTMEVDLPEAKYPDREAQAAFFGRALERLRAMPGVASAGAITDLPLSREYSINGIRLKTDPPVQGRAAFHSVDPDYFQTMGIPLLRGRLLSSADSAHAAAVGVINRKMAERYWPNADPIGKTILVSRVIGERTAEGIRLRSVEGALEIAGVVGDVRMLGRDADVRPEVFFPYTQRPSDGMAIVLRAAGNPATLIAGVKKEIWRVDPDLPVTDIQTMDAVVAADVAERRFVLLLIGAFALMAAVLAAVGIYGVVSYSVRQRTQEIGIRVALGAQASHVIWLVLRQTAAWLLAGMAAGMASASALTRLLAAHLYGVKPTDPATFALAAVALAAIALAANAMPVRRAVRVDPVAALHYE